MRGASSNFGNMFSMAGAYVFLPFLLAFRENQSPRFRWTAWIWRLGGSLESWDAIAPALNQHYRTLRYDQRGSGLSEKVRHPFRLEDLVNDLAQLLTQMPVPPPYYLLGAAAGAALAILFAASYPTWVEKLVLCNPATAMNDQQRRFLQERAPLAEREGMRATLPLSLARSSPEEIISDCVTYETYKARFLANDPTSYAFMNRALVEMNVSHIINRIRCPTLVLAGKHDRVRPPAEVAEFARSLPGAKFEILDFAVALHESHHVSDDLYRMAVKTLTERGVVELVGLLGYYTLMSMTLNVFEIGVSEDEQAELAP